VRRVIAAAGLAAALGACGTTEREGAVGDTLSSRTLDATLLAVPTRRPQLFRVRMRLCRDEPGQAVNAFAFTLVLDDDSELQPQSLLTDFDVVREGCETGWIVYQVAGDAAPDELRFSYDDTGSAQPGDREEHADFTWDVTAR
jgi:hypothetical protein